VAEGLHLVLDLVFLKPLPHTFASRRAATAVRPSVHCQPALAASYSIPQKKRPMDCFPLPEHALLQLIDSTTIFNEFRRVQSQAREVTGGMYWKRQGGYEYLVRTQPDGRPPPAFVEFKRWMAAKAPRRAEIQRRRDLLQADIVQRLLDDGLLAPAAA
jgi:hypothetical protein